MTQPLLTEPAALSHVGSREWKKGQPYVQGLSGLWASPDGEGLTLRGRAHGQETYQVMAQLRGGEVLDAECSCPVGGGGGCKHVAALLARAVGSPQDFTRLPDLTEQLDAMDAPALRRLVRSLLEREPELTRLLMLAPSGEGRAALATLAHRIESALELLDYDPEEDWEGEGPDLSDLIPLAGEVQEAAQGAAALDAEERRALLGASLALLEGCAELNDDDYALDLDVLILPARTALLRLLAPGAGLESQGREEALTGLEKAVQDLGWDRAEWEEGGQSELFAALPEEERRRVLAFTEHAMKGEKARHVRQALAGTLLMMCQDETMSLEEERALARATGKQAEVVRILLRHGQTEEAVRALTGAERALAPQEVEAEFAEHGLLPQLEAHAAAHLDVFGARAWLYTRFRDSGRTEQAHALAREAALKGTGLMALLTSHFLESDLNWLDELRAISPDWPADRAAYIQHHWKRPASAQSLMLFLMQEGQDEQAERLVSRDQKTFDLIGPTLVAQLALRLDAERAKPLLLRAVLAEVAQRSRPHYHAAAQTLRDAAPLLGEEEVRATARMLLRDFPKLRALKDELVAAGLV